MEELTTKEIRELIEAGKTDKIPPEDLSLYYENMGRRNSYELNEIGVRNLYAAICMQSIEDYRIAMKRCRKVPDDKEATKEAKECLTFFKSSFFTDIVGEKSLGEITSASRRIPEGGYNHYLKKKP